MSPVSSMTGFATAAGTIPATGESFTLTLKSVNHRHLDLQLRLPYGLDALEATLRRVFKERLRRGHVEFTLSFDGKSASAAQAAIALDEPVLAVYAAAFHRAAQLHHPHAEPNIHELLRMPGVLAANTEPASSRRIPADVEDAVLPVIETLLAAFQQARASEGAALAAELRASLDRVAALVEEASLLRAGIGASQLERLRARMAELLEGVAVSEERLLTEAALLADRGDVEEELVRLRTHVARFQSLLDTGGETGKQLDFLLQELNREANTLLSKTAGASGLRITEIGLALKLEFERAREQVQNLE
jgi:uncharacterized protein (TIGR00255 family)